MATIDRYIIRQFLINLIMICVIVIAGSIFTFSRFVDGY